MPSDLLQSLIAFIAAISAMLAARFLVRALARKQPAEAPRVPPVVPATPTPAAGPPTPQEVALAQSPTPMSPVTVVRERPTRRLDLTDARRGIVVATILGPCWAQSPDEGP